MAKAKRKNKATKKVARRSVPKKRTVKRRSAAKKKNPATPKLKKLTGSTGWIQGDAFRIVKKRGGGVEVYIRRGKTKRSR